MSPQQHCSLLLILIALCHAGTDFHFPAASAASAAPELKAAKVERFQVAAEVAHNVARRFISDIGQLESRRSRNILFSPLSVGVTIAQLMLAGKGATHEQLRSWLIGDATSSLSATPDVDLHRQLGDAFNVLQQSNSTSDDYRVSGANTFFMQVGLMVKSRFLEEIKKYYNSGYNPADFKNDPINTLNAINKWGSDNTGGLIPTILVEPLPSRTAVVLMNAIYFRARWETPFSAQLTIPGKFRVNDTASVDVENMRGQFDDLLFADSEDLGCRLIALPYKRKGVNMYVMLPRQGLDVMDFIKGVTWQKTMAIIESAENHSVIVVLPKMKLTESVSLKGPLFATRTKEPRAVTKKPKPKTTTPTPIKAESRVDLTGASTDERFTVDDILHQVSLEVTETGTEAAAISVGSSYYSGDVKNFKVDRPFAFFIRDEETRVNLFEGIVRDPNSAE